MDYEILDAVKGCLNRFSEREWPNDFPKLYLAGIVHDAKSLAEDLVAMESHLRKQEVFAEELITVSKIVRSMIIELEDFRAKSRDLDSWLSNYYWNQYAGNGHVWKWYSVFTEIEHPMVQEYNLRCGIGEASNQGLRIFGNAYERKDFDKETIDFLERLKEALVTHESGTLWGRSAFRNEVEMKMKQLNQGLVDNEVYLQLRESMEFKISEMRSLIDNVGREC